MRRPDRIIIVILLLLAVVLMNSCQKHYDSKYMVPSLDDLEIKSGNTTLNVANVKVDEKKMPVTGFPPKQLTGKTFKEALINTLDNSGIFRRVGGFIDSKYDYVLYTFIISHKFDATYHPDMLLSATLVVNYRLIQTTSNKVIWKETIFSQYETMEGSALKRVQLVANEVVKENLTELVKKLSAVLNQYNSV